MDTIQLDELIAKCDSLRLTDEIVAPLLLSSGLSREEFCDVFSRRVAHRYAAGEIDFDVGDAAMNSLFGFGYLGADNVLPTYSWDVFLAFDDGEYHRSEDDPSICPEDRYSRPQILEIVARDTGGA